MENPLFLSYLARDIDAVEMCLKLSRIFEAAPEKGRPAAVAVACADAALAGSAACNRV